MEVDDTPPAPAPKKSPTPSPRSRPIPTTASRGGGGGAAGEVSDRLDLYKRAVQQAELAGEGAKVRRYKRSITTLEQVGS